MSTATDGKNFGQLNYPPSTIYVSMYVIFADGESQSAENAFVVDNFAGSSIDHRSRDHAQTIKVTTRLEVPVIGLAEIPNMYSLL
jgi:hypothetical protein